MPLPSRILHVTRANELANGTRFDVILSDLMMPGLTGMDLHAHLVEHIPEQTKQMVFMTGGACTPLAQAFLENPEIRWLEKPFNVVELRRQFQAVAQQSPPLGMVTPRPLQVSRSQAASSQAARVSRTSS